MVGIYLRGILVLDQHRDERRRENDHKDHGQFDTHRVDEFWTNRASVVEGMIDVLPRNGFAIE